VANVAISNVPGPPVPLYLAGARMTANYPTSIVIHGVGLNITVQSYDQSLDFGIMACAKAMPEVAEVAEGLQIAFDELRLLPLPEDAPSEVRSRMAETLSGLQSLQAIGSTIVKAVSKATAVARASPRAGAPSRRARAR